jgi:hypothetical protein
MKKKGNKPKLSDRQEGKETENIPDGYQLYPDSEDIYNKYQKEKDINPEDISKNKKSNIKGKSETGNGTDYNDDEAGLDLDIPGSELDDDQEIIGSEDEENNYYSLGGDDHNDLDEDKEE